MKTVLYAALLLICAAVSCALWYWYFYRRENRLLERLMEMLDEAEAGALQRREISEEKLSALENRLKKYLDSSMLENRDQKQQKDIIQRLISDISHQTLTPIANLKIYTDLLLETADDEAGIVKTIQEQTDKLDFLIQSLVKLSRMESGIIKVHPRKNEIRGLFDILRREYEGKAKLKGLALTFREPGLQAEFDSRWTAEAAGNIVDNAIKYTPPGGHVTVSAAAYSFFVRIDIIDDGIGIPQEECSKIFARFYRSLEVSGQPGVGIGLYLAREFIQAQAGYIKVTSKKGAGSTFSIFLPVQKYQNCNTPETG